MTFPKIQKQPTLYRGTSNIRVFSGLLVLLTAIVLLTPSPNAQLSGKGEIKGIVTNSSAPVVPAPTVTPPPTTQRTKLSRPTALAFCIAGPQANNTNGNATTNSGIVNGSGSRGAVSAIYIDGIPFVRAGGNGDPRYVWTAISVDAVDQFQVQTNGYSAIYEGQGIQNYNIKAGGSKYHGSVYEFFRNTALDTWGFFGPANISPVTGKPVKPIEHSNDDGINLSAPLVPVGTWRDKLFFFGNYHGFRYSSQTPTPMTFPTAAEQPGNFNGLITRGIFEPSTDRHCQAFNGARCRSRYGS